MFHIVFSFWFQDQSWYFHCHYRKLWYYCKLNKWLCYLYKWLTCGETPREFIQFLNVLSSLVSPVKRERHHLLVKVTPLCYVCRLFWGSLWTVDAVYFWIFFEYYFSWMSMLIMTSHYKSIQKTVHPLRIKLAIFAALPLGLLYVCVPVTYTAVYHGSICCILNRLIDWHWYINVGGHMFMIAMS